LYQIDTRWGGRRILMLKNIDMGELVDISDVKVDKNMTRDERIAEYHRQIKDPNKYKCCGFKITANFAEKGATIEECFRSIYSS
jgi:hypothetical protein